MMHYEIYNCKYFKIVSFGLITKIALPLIWKKKILLQYYTFLEQLPVWNWSIFVIDSILHSVKFSCPALLFNSQNREVFKGLSAKVLLLNFVPSGTYSKEMYPLLYVPVSMFYILSFWISRVTLTLHYTKGGIWLPLVMVLKKEEKFPQHHLVSSGVNDRSSVLSYKIGDRNS